jgi:hypothetical protein
MTSPAEFAQRPEILCGLNRDFLTAELDCRQRGQYLPGLIEVSLVIETLQDLGQHQVANCQRLLARQHVEYFGLRRPVTFQPRKAWPCVLLSLP